MQKITERSSGIYIHIPFCRKKCLYCDFYSEEISSKDIIDNYSLKVVDELERRWEELSGTEIMSLYIGGGTPSSLGEKNIRSISDAVAKNGIDLKKIEFTLEINPVDATPCFLDGLVNAGVNRLSMGVQAFDDEVLRKMGRGSSIKEIAESLQFIGERFENYSVDIMYGIGENRNLISEMKSVFDLADPCHVSAYAYTPPDRSGAPCPLIEEETVLQEKDIVSFLHSKGFKRYEISNYALPGRESVHNMIYWKYGSWLGIGAAACSFIGSRKEHSFYGNSIELFIEEGGLSRYTVSFKEQVTEFMLMGLRLTEGISVSRFENIFGKSFKDIFFGKRLETLSEKGFCELVGDNFRCTDKGLDFLNHVLVELTECLK